MKIFNTEKPASKVDKLRQHFHAEQGAMIAAEERIKVLNTRRDELIAETPLLTAAADAASAAKKCALNKAIIDGDKDPANLRGFNLAVIEAQDAVQNNADMVEAATAAIKSAHNEIPAIARRVADVRRTILNAMLEEEKDAVRALVGDQVGRIFALIISASDGALIGLPLSAVFTLPVGGELLKLQREIETEIRG